MGSSPSCLRMPKCRGVDIEELSIKQLQAHLHAGSFTCEDLTRCYLKRIELLNPRIRAVIETNPDCLVIAKTLDAERLGGATRSSIHGIPFLVKDNIVTKDQMQTTAGCAALLGSQVPDDAPVVARLRAAGGVLLGKANLSEWASMRASYYAEGYSSRGGQNRNPYNLAEHAGGSSSGSASAVAANMCAFSIGTETDGSVMFPAGRNAVVGIKPTVGLTSTLGVIPESHSMDTVGTFGRCVEDATTVLDIIANSKSEPDAQFSSSADDRDARQQSLVYRSHLAKRDALKGARFGLPMKRVWESAEKNAKHRSEYRTLMKLISRMRNAGAQIVDVDFPSAEDIISQEGWDWTYADGEPGSKLSEFEVVRVEFYNGLKNYLSTLGGLGAEMRTLEDVVAYNVENTDREGGVPGTHPAWPTGQDNLDKCVESRGDDGADYQKALDYITRKSRVEGIDVALSLRGGGTLDGLLVPLQADQGAACSVAAKAGYPMITVPVGINENDIAFGLAIIQTARQEGSLIRYAAAIEGLVGPRSRPKFVNYDAETYPYIEGPLSDSTLRT